MQVIKRDGKKENISFDKILYRIKNLCALPNDLNTLINLNPETHRKYEINKYFKPLYNADFNLVARETIKGVYNGVSTRELDELAASVAQPMILEHPDYGVLASRILISNFHKNTVMHIKNHYYYKYAIVLDEIDIENDMIYYIATVLYENIDENGDQNPLIAPDVYQFIINNKEKLQQIIKIIRDYDYDYVGFKLLEESYLQKCSLFSELKQIRVPIETPQFMLIRIAIGIHISNKYKNFNKMRQNDIKIYEYSKDLIEQNMSSKTLTKFKINVQENTVIWKEIIQLLNDKGVNTNSLEQCIKNNTKSWNMLLNDFKNIKYENMNEIMENIIETYELTSKKTFTHATPTLFNAGSLKPQLSSCFLIQIPQDSIEGITKYWKQCSLISQHAGGIGSHAHNIRAKNSYIRGTNGTSNGLPPMLRVLNDISVYIDQCFHPDTIVYTKSGPKKISDILITDYLITNDGTFDKINEIRQYNTKDMLSDNPTEITNKIKMKKIACKHSIEPVMVTNKHPFLVIECKKGINFKTIKARLDNVTIEPQWVEAKDLTENHMISFPIPKYENDIDIYDLEDCYMYGIMLGDGSISKDSLIYHIYLNSTTKKHIVEFVKDYLGQRNITYSISETDLNKTGVKSIKITWSKNQYFPFNRAMLYKGSDDHHSEKYITEAMLHLPREKSFKLIEGLIDTDGCVYKEITIEMTSRNVIESLRYILLRFGIGSSGYIRDRIGESHELPSGSVITTKKKTYVLRIPKVEEICDMYSDLEPSRNTTYFIHEGILYSRIETIETVEYSGLLTDFEINFNHNYLTHIGLAHNGGNKRPGSHAVYLEPWHADIFEVLSLKKNRGNELERARQLFYAVWANDEFMRTVEYEATHGGKMWYLMCPDKFKNLANLYDNTFRTTWITDEELFSKNESFMKKEFAFTYQYRKYIKENNIKAVSAIELWKLMCELFEETGVPYVVYKDSSNRKSNHKNLGTIKSSNLCVAPETLILTDQGHIKISELENKEVNIWNGFEWSKVIVKKTSDNSELIKIHFDNGTELECTKYHKFHIMKNSLTIINADELKENDKIIDYKLPSCNIVQSIKINKIEITNRYDKTYCFNEPKRHTGIFNGVLTGNCTEIIEYSSAEEAAVCNLTSTNLTSFIVDGKPNYLGLFEKIFINNNTKISSCLLNGFNHSKGVRYIDFNLFEQIIRRQVKNLNKIIDIEYYPIKEAEYSNFKNRPIAIGVQDFANMLVLLRLPFDSKEALEFNSYLFEFMYYIACDESVELAKIYGSYDSFKGSPASEGLLQFDLWEQENSEMYKANFKFNKILNWQLLKEKISNYGMRNSLLLALMPTGSTSTILGSTACFEPFNSMVYKRKNKTGESIIINRYLVQELIDNNIWNQNIKNQILLNSAGSIADITKIPKEIRDLYKTVWDISPKITSNMCLTRSHYIDQSQSYTVFIKEPTVKILTQFHFYNWKCGIKTSSYYTRRLAVADANKVQVVNKEPEIQEPEFCTLGSGCKSCES